ncbi:MAG: helix-turn-helix domain-containing protein [Pseudomonadota bacterium]
MLPIGVEGKDQAENCPIRSVLANVSGKWRILILLALEDGPKRFGVMKRCIGDTTQRVLTENLRSLQRDGYLTRTVDPDPPIAVTYALTPLGEELASMMKPLVFWSNSHMEQVHAARTAYDDASPA